MAQQYYYKIVLLGDAGVGKTSLFNRIKSGRFIETPTTVGGQGADQYMYTTTIGEDSLNVSLWDTAGGERFRTLTNNFYRDAHGAMLVYSVEDSYTFENLKDWIDDAAPYIDLDTFEWELIGNKSDLGNEVEKERVQARLDQLNAKLFYYTSAKTGKNVEQAFNSLVSTIHKKCTMKQATSQTRQRENTVVVDSTATSSEQKKNSCC